MSMLFELTESEIAEELNRFAKDIANRLGVQETCSHSGSSAVGNKSESAKKSARDQCCSKKNCETKSNRTFTIPQHVLAKYGENVEFEQEISTLPDDSIVVKLTPKPKMSTTEVRKHLDDLKGYLYDCGMRYDKLYDAVKKLDEIENML